MNQIIEISCIIVDSNGVVIGRWQHQKIELTKFAYRYNEKTMRLSAAKSAEENSQYQIKVNPLSG